MKTVNEGRSFKKVELEREGWAIVGGVCQVDEGFFFFFKVGKLCLKADGVPEWLSGLNVSLQLRS